ncbi:MAG: hypothetical protein Q7S37_00910 [bacterium]|nr:hypothetical protein [bacterium]
MMVLPSSTNAKAVLPESAAFAGAVVMIRMSPGCRSILGGRSAIPTYASIAAEPTVIIFASK